MTPFPSAESRWSAGILLAFVLALSAGWLILTASFQFPEILRASAEERFNLFQAGQGIIVPAYYLMSLSAVLQVFMVLAVFRLGGKKGLLDLAAVGAGVLAGVFQILGFFRWVILMPMLSNVVVSQEIPADAVYFFEKYANTYLGMTVGEHLGTFFLGIWLVLSSVRYFRNGMENRPLSVLGLVSGGVLFLSSFENVVPAFGWMGSLTAAVWGLYLVWTILIAVVFLSGKTLHWGWWVFGLVFYLANVVPSFL